MEGPSLVILREELQPFLGQKVLKVSGNTTLPKELLKGRKLEKIDTWAKVLFMTFTKPRSKPIITKTHFLMFGSYRINDPKENRTPRLELKFKNGILYFYACSLQFNGDEYLKDVDREVDVMSPKWNEDHVLELMKKKKSTYLCDLFLDQSIFAGSGNIVKNEVLFNIRRHPLTKLSQVEKKDWPKVAEAVREYCHNFYEWKKIYELRQHWQVYKKSTCPLCNRKLTRQQLGQWKRRTFFCNHCQKLPVKARKLKVFPVLPITKKLKKEARLDH
jgi:endonuclease-8